MRQPQPKPQVRTDPPPRGSGETRTSPCLTWLDVAPEQWLWKHSPKLFTQRLDHLIQQHRPTAVFTPSTPLAH